MNPSPVIPKKPAEPIFVPGAFTPLSSPTEGGLCHTPFDGTAHRSLVVASPCQGKLALYFHNPAFPLKRPAFLRVEDRGDHSLRRDILG